MSFFHGRGACRKCGQSGPAYRTFLSNCPANVISVLRMCVHFVEQKREYKNGSFVDIASCDVTCQLVLDSLGIAKDLLVVFRLLFNLCRPLLSIFSWRVACNLEGFMLLSQQLSMLNPFHQKQQFPCKCERYIRYTWHPTLHPTRIHLRFHQTKGLFRVRTLKNVPFGGSFYVWVLHVRSSSYELTHALDPNLHIYHWNPGGCPYPNMYIYPTKLW